MKTTLLHTSLIAAITATATAPALAQATIDPSDGVAISAVPIGYIGSNTTPANAAHKNAVAIGNSAQAKEDASTAVGANSKAQNLHAAAFGSGADARGRNSVAVGHNTLANSRDSIAIGDNAKSTTAGDVPLLPNKGHLPNHQSGIAIGANAWAQENGVHIGHSKTAPARSRRGAVTVGTDVKNDGLVSTIVGNGTHLVSGNAKTAGVGTQGLGVTSIGAYNNIKADGTKALEGVAVGIVGVANKIEASNGVTVMGVGNTVTNAYGDESKARFTFADALKIMQGDLSSLGGKELGSVSVVGGGNTVADSTTTSITGLHNKVENESKHVFLAGSSNQLNKSTEIIALGNHNHIKDSSRSIVLGYQIAPTNTAGGGAGAGTPVGPGAPTPPAGTPTHSAVEGLKNSVVIGSDYTVGKSTENGVLIGQEAKLTANHAAAVGYQAEVSVEGGVAIGAKSVANREAIAADDAYVPTGASTAQSKAIQNTVKGSLAAVSVGHTGGTRQIINVAAGSKDSDAVNVAQLKAVQSQSSQAVQDLEGKLNDRIGNVDKDLRGGIASATAIAMLQTPPRPGSNTVSVAVGGYRGASALAVGYAATNDEGNLSMKFGVGLNNRRDFNWGGSLGYSW